MGEIKMNRTLTAILGTGIIVAGTVGYTFGKSSVEQEEADSDLLGRVGVERNRLFRERVMGIFYPKMWDGDVLGNYWLDQSKAPAKIWDGDSLGNYWVSDDKIIEQLRQIYTLNCSLP